MNDTKKAVVCCATCMFESFSTMQAPCYACIDNIFASGERSGYVPAEPIRSQNSDSKSGQSPST